MIFHVNLGEGDRATGLCVRGCLRDHRDSREVRALKVWALMASWAWGSSLNGYNMGPFVVVQILKEVPSYNISTILGFVIYANSQIFRQGCLLSVP